MGSVTGDGTEPSGKPYRRSKIPLAEKRTQVYLSLVLIFYLVLYTIALVAAILLPSILKLTFDDIPLEIQLQAGREFLFIDRRVVPIILVIMTGLAIHFTFITHRIFGPFVRFKTLLVAWSDGKWPRAFQPRQKDFHGDLFDLFNASLVGVGRNLRTVRRLLREAAGAAGDPSRAEAAGRKCEEALSLLDEYFGEEEEHGESSP